MKYYKGKYHTGRCNACGRESIYCERDHRVPPRLGGGQTQRNLQDLCLECHRRKTHLEVSLFDFNCETETVRDWFFLAFQNDDGMIKTFLDELALRLSHFREVKAGLAALPRKFGNEG